MRAWPRLTLSLAALLAIAPLAAARSPADEPSVAPFTLAILRQDGIVIPFASWDGKRWGNDWPVPAKSVDTPITLDAIPKRWWSKPGPVSAWHVWQVDGSQSEIRATAPTWLPAHCQQAVGLRTSLPLRGPTPPLRVQPYPKVGLAASRPLDFKPIGIVEAQAPIATVLIKTLATLVDEDEDREALRYQASSGWTHPYDAKARRATPLRVEALYRMPLDAGRLLYYYEVAKRYPPLRAASTPASSTPTSPDACEVATVIAGWFATGPDGKTIDLKTRQTRMTSCSYESVDVMLPLAYVTLGERRVWIGQFSGWDREQYLVIDPQRPLEEMVLWSTHGGQCATGSHPDG